MSSDIISEEGKIQRRILRRRKMIIIDEVYEEFVREEPFEDMFRKVILHEVPPSFQRVSTGMESRKEPFIDDLDERKELAKIVDLVHIPEKTINAFEEINGLLDSFICTEKIDTVKMVKILRKRC